MTTSRIAEKVKERDGSIAKAGKKLGIENRQTMNNYIKRYENGELDKIPKNVCIYLQNLGNNNGSFSMEDMSFFRKLSEEGRPDKAIRALQRSIEIACEEREEMQKIVEINTGENKGPYTQYTSLGSNTPEETTEFQKNAIQQYDQFIEKAKEELNRIRGEMTVDDPAEWYSPEAIIREGLKEGAYGGPSWSGKDFGVVSIQDDGNYMVIVDKIGRDARDLKLILYAVISGKMEQIATYYFENPHENFVKFSLVPKLPYYFQVVSDSIDARNYTSGILPLKNDA